MVRQYYKFLIHPQFYIKFADRVYQLPTQEVGRGSEPSNPCTEGVMVPAPDSKAVGWETASLASLPRGDVRAQTVVLPT